MPRPKKSIAQAKKEATLAAAAISIGTKAKKDILDNVEKKAAKTVKKKEVVIENADAKEAVEVKKSEAEKPAAEKKSKATKKTATEKKTATAKKSAAASVETNIELQFGEKSISYAALLQDAKNKFQYDMGGDADKIKSIELYVKPEDNKVYFVIDGIEGDFDI